MSTSAATEDAQGGPGFKRWLWWGGLATLAAVEVIDWPVAAVVGAGSYVAERFARSGTHPGTGRVARPTGTLEPAEPAKPRKSPPKTEQAPEKPSKRR